LRTPSWVHDVYTNDRSAAIWQPYHKDLLARLTDGSAKLFVNGKFNFTSTHQ
jgi:hypothetical protein